MVDTLDVDLLLLIALERERREEGRRRESERERGRGGGSIIGYEGGGRQPERERVTRLTRSIG